MIKADELREFRPVVRYRDGNQITLQTVQEAIKDCAQGMGIPVAFYTDQVKSVIFVDYGFKKSFIINH